MISRKYVKGWFFMDLLMVVSDWVSFAATELSDGTDASTTTGLKLVRFLKLAKFLRILGLMRMIRFSKLFEELLDRSLAGGFRVVFDFDKALEFQSRVCQYVSLLLCGILVSVDLVRLLSASFPFGSSFVSVAKAEEIAW